MRTARLETVRDLVSVASTRCCSREGGSHVNKFEQVFSDQHQISLGGGLQVWCPGGTLPDLSR